MYSYLYARDMRFLAALPANGVSSARFYLAVIFLPLSIRPSYYSISFMKTSADRGKNLDILNEVLAEELHAMQIRN